MTTAPPHQPAPKPSTTPAKAYVFSDPAEGERHHGELVSHLAAVLDPFTTRRLEPFIKESSRCLEIGAGAGTVAVWMADRAAEVTGTDTDPQHIPPHPKLTALRHDIRTDPLEPERYDLIHARLVLAHLAPGQDDVLDRYEVLDKLVDALAPGGVLVVDEFASGGWERCVLDAPDEDAQRLFNSYHQALVMIMESTGTDTGWGRNVHRALRHAGLVDVQGEFGGALTWHGGQAGCLLPYSMAAQVRPQLVEAGMSETDIDRFRNLLIDPRLVIHSSIAVSTSGRRP